LKTLLTASIIFTLVAWAHAAPVEAPPSPPSPPSPPTAPATTPLAKQLTGTWKVDLRAEPGAAPYFQKFVIESVDASGKSFKGNFYNSDISWARINSSWGKTVVTFMTSDGQGEYVHTATIQGKTMTGSSSARHRNLLVPWTAELIVP